MGAKETFSSPQKVFLCPAEELNYGWECRPASIRLGPAFPHFMEIDTLYLSNNTEKKGHFVSKEAKETFSTPFELNTLRLSLRRLSLWHSLSHFLLLIWWILQFVLINDYQRIYQDLYKPKKHFRPHSQVREGLSLSLATSVPFLV
jgi:hypothetical protein